MCIRDSISTADAGYREPDFARDPASANHRALTAEIRKAKEIAKGAGMVALNAMVATQDYAAALRTAVEAGVDAVVSLSLIHIWPHRRGGLRGCRAGQPLFHGQHEHCRGRQDVYKRQACT